MCIPDENSSSDPECQNLFSLCPTPIRQPKVRGLSFSIGIISCSQKHLRAARKSTNLSKVAKVRQLDDESPSEFLERLLKAYRIYTAIDPVAPENARAIDIAFVTIGP